MNAIQINKKITYIKTEEMLKHIRYTVDNMSDIVFTSKDVDTHSIRSSLVMKLYLAKHPSTIIMLLGRWGSDTFLLYICR